MKRLIASLLLAVTLLTVFPTNGLAFSAEKHDSYMTQVLFGRDNAYGNYDEVKMLEAASFLCLDFTNEPKGTEQLTLLRGGKVKTIPKTAAEFSFTSNQYHRRYTHLGWTYVYGEDDKANWEVRKNILLATVNKIFDFGTFTGIRGRMKSYTAKCEAFSALIYYVHVIGDYCTDGANHGSESVLTMQDLVPLASDRDDSDIITELEYYLANLFVDQKGSRVYTTMMTDLQLLRNDITEQNYDYANLTEADKTELENWANQLMELLIADVPLLLQKEEFFTEVFG